MMGSAWRTLTLRTMGKFLRCSSPIRLVYSLCSTRRASFPKPLVWPWPALPRPRHSNKLFVVDLDKTLITKLRDNLKDKRFVPPIGNSFDFSVVHYAGRVTYNTEGIVVHNVFVVSLTTQYVHLMFIFSLACQEPRLAALGHHHALQKQQE
jgi:hypothetical protein